MGPIGSAIDNLEVCAYCKSGSYATELVYLVSSYKGWPIKLITQCKACASWGLRIRPDLYSLTYKQAQVNQTTRLLTEG